MSTPRRSPSDRRRPSAVSIRDIASRAGVSIATVSRTVNGISTVNPELARKVWQAIEEVGYLPNTQARALVSGRSHTLGLIVSEITNPFFPELVQEFEYLAVAQGYEVLIGSTNYEASRTESLMRRVLQRNVDGVAVMTFGVEEELVQKLVEREFPLSLSTPAPTCRTSASSRWTMARAFARPCSIWPRSAIATLHSSAVLLHSALRQFGGTLFSDPCPNWD